MDALGIAKLFEPLGVPLMTAPNGRLTLEHAIWLVVLVGTVFWVTEWLERRAIKPALERLGLDEGAVFMIGRSLHYLLGLLSVLVGAQLLRIDLGELGLVFGLLSIGIGFGLQNVTSNFVAGLIIMYEQPIKPGDFVAVGEHTGLVRDIRLRATTIVTMDNIKIVVPNSEFISQRVINRSFGDDKIRLHIPVRLAYGVDPETVKTALAGAAAENPRVLPHPAPTVWLKEFATDGLIFELVVWIQEPQDASPIRSEISYAIYRECRAQGLEMPHAQLDLHVQGSVPVRMEAERRILAAPEPAESLIQEV